MRIELTTPGWGTIVWEGVGRKRKRGKKGGGGKERKIHKERKNTIL